MEIHEMKSVYLIYPRAHEKTGSTQMRVFQLKQIIESYGTKKIEIHDIEVSNLRLEVFWKIWSKKIRKGSILIFCKYAIDRIPASILAKLKSERGCIISVDYIDRSLRNFDLSIVDIHIASCTSQFNYLNTFETEKSKVILLPHQADNRLNTILETHKTKKICYLGENANLFIPIKHIQNISSIPYNGRVTIDTLRVLSKFRFHYCIRPSHQITDMNCFKPPTKVMNAIALNAVPLISIDQTDAVDILGEDFPFILRDLTEKGFDDIFKKINYDQDLYDTSIEIIRAKNLENSFQKFAMQFEDEMIKIFNRHLWDK